jgi:hypothetical protein
MLIQKYLIRLNYQKKGGSNPMKKKFAVTLAVVIALGITTMYTYPHIAVRAFTSAPPQSEISSYALEGVDIISENDTNEIETKYSVYKTYGMTYDKEKELKRGIEDSQKSISDQYDNFEGGEPDYKNDSIRDVYAPYGVTYDAFSGAWLFKGKIIHFLQDEGQATYCDNSESAIANGINIEVIRSKGGKIKTLKVKG